jgi:hypothetical protein
MGTTWRTAWQLNPVSTTANLLLSLSLLVLIVRTLRWDYDFEWMHLFIFFGVGLIVLSTMIRLRRAFAVSCAEPLDPTLADPAALRQRLIAIAEPRERGIGPAFFIVALSGAALVVLTHVLRSSSSALDGSFGTIFPVLFLAFSARGSTDDDLLLQRGAPIRI